MCFKIDCASLIAASKFTVFALFYFVSEGNFPSISPWGAYIWRGDLAEGFLHYRFGGLIIIWRGLYMEGLIFGILRYFFKEMYANQSGELYVDIGVKRVNGNLCQVDTSL